MGGPSSQGEAGGNKDPTKIVANIFISFIGAGVLGLPFAFKKAGLIEGVLVMVFVSYFAYRAMLLIIDCKYKVVSKLYEYEGLTDVMQLGTSSEKQRTVDNKRYLQLPLLEEEDEDEYEDTSNPCNNNQKKTADVHNKKETSIREKNVSVSYSDIGFAAFGMVGRTTIDFALLTSQVGFCCAYLIFISENLESLVPSVEKSSWLLVLLPPLFLLTLVKDLSRFAVFSIFAQVSNLFAFSVVYWFDFQHLHLAQVEPKEFSVEGFPYYFSVAIYCFEGAGMILSLEESLAVEVRKQFTTYFRCTIVAITTLYITFGAAGYLSYGPATKDIITLNLPVNEGLNFAALVKSCLCFSLFFTYPMMLFPVFSILEKKLTITELPYTLFLRLFIVALSGLIVVKVPNFGQLMALVGATCCNLLAYIMPALCHLVLFRTELTAREKTYDCILLFIGLSGAIVGTVDLISSAT